MGPGQYSEEDARHKLLTEVLAHFAIDGTLKEIQEVKVGHLHTTLRTVWETPVGDVSYVHQQINTKVFKDVDALMSNMRHVTQHVSQKIKRGYGVEGEVALTLVPTHTGGAYLKARSGECWRTFEYVKDSISYSVCTNSEIAYAASSAFGRFQQHLSDLSHSLADTIPDFMNCEGRWLRFHEAVQKDTHQRAETVKKEIEYIYSEKDLFSLIEEGQRRGELPKRATHGDMKLNNLLFSTITGHPICVVDLDTCMMGSYLFDFGDLVRVAASTAAEDERDLSQVSINLEYYEALVQGYGDTVRQLMTSREKEIAYLAPQLLALTVGTRFLTDYLSGDVYFRIEYPTHNMERARNQIALAQQMQSQKSALQRLTKQGLGS